jgi:DNA-binding transcriptional MocR family regulator
VQTSTASAYKISGQGASEIAASIETGIAQGGLAPGAALPPIRDLAVTLAVNPNTVSAAYRLLRERGAIETGGRRGTRVRERPATSPRNLGFPIPDGARDLANGSPDARLLPELRFGDHAPSAPRLYYGAAVLSGLLDAARDRLAHDGVPADHVTLTFGAGDAIERVFAAHLRPGDSVAVEDPGWGTVFHLLPAMGLTPVPVPVDDEGMIPSRLARALARGVRAVMVTSRAQNPTGAAVTAARAAELRSLLSSHPTVLLVEDDHGADINRDHPLHTLVGRTPHWAHIRSVSKAYGPDLRCAVVAADETTTARVAGRLRLGPGWVSTLVQEEVRRLWTDPEVERQIAAACASYTERRKALIDALAARGVPAHGATGINVWIPVPEEAPVVSSLLSAGWAVAPGAWFRKESPPGVRITVSTLEPGEIEPIADAVAKALRTEAGVAAI